MKTKSMILLACAALLTSNIAFAEPKEFKDADANGDKIIDNAEFAASGIEDKKYSEVDTNKDGKIDKEEYTAVLEECE